MKLKKRWYDAHPRLAESLDALKIIDKDARDRIVSQVIGTINDYSPGLIEKYLLEFPLDRERRRWYDKDPYLWLMVNGLRFAPPDLLRKVTNYMGKATRQGKKKEKAVVRTVRRPKHPDAGGWNRRRARPRRRPATQRAAGL